jgi:hypothetical protein
VQCKVPGYNRSDTAQLKLLRTNVVCASQINVSVRDETGAFVPSDSEPVRLLAIARSRSPLRAQPHVSGSLSEVFPGVYGPVLFVSPRHCDGLSLVRSLSPVEPLPRMVGAIYRMPVGRGVKFFLMTSPPLLAIFHGPLFGGPPPSPNVSHSHPRFLYLSLSPRVGGRRSCMMTRHLATLRVIIPSLEGWLPPLDSPEPLVLHDTSSPGPD